MYTNQKNHDTTHMPDRTRRNFIKGVGAIVAGGTLLRAEHVLAATHVPKQINIGTFGPSHCAVPFAYAKLRGFFAQEKLQINLINYPAMSLIAKDLINGKLDFGQLIVPLALAIHTGAKPFSTATPIVIPQVTGTNGAALMVRKGTGIQSPADFKGKTLSNHSKLSVHYLINMMFLEKHGLNYHKDLTIKIVELGKVVDAVKNGQVDAFVMPEPKDALMENMGIADVYMLSKYVWPNHPCCALVATRKTLERNREQLISVTRAMTRAGLMANAPDTREETIDLLRASAEYKYDKLPKNVLMKAFTPGRADFYPFPYQSAAMLIIEEMKKHNLLDANLDGETTASEVFLSDLSRSIMEDLGAKTPTKNHRAERILGELKGYAS